MEEKFRYTFDYSTGILYKFYYGPITIEDIYSSWDYAIKNSLIPQETKGFILDYRKATFDFDIREYSRIADYYKAHLHIFRNYKIAIITQTPEDVIVPALVETKDEGYKSRPFYSVEAAINWIFEET